MMLLLRWVIGVCAAVFCVASTILCAVGSISFIVSVFALFAGAGSVVGPGASILAFAVAGALALATFRLSILALPSLSPVPSLKEIFS